MYVEGMEHLRAFLMQLLTMLIALTTGTTVAFLLECTGIRYYIARYMQIFTRIAHLPAHTASSFASSFISPYTANALLGEEYTKKNISTKALFIANIFNSFSTAFGHSITLFFISYPLLRTIAIQYIAIILCSALLRTLVATYIGYILLPVPEDYTVAITKSTYTYTIFFSRLTRRLYRIFSVSIPVYSIVYIAEHTNMLSSLSTLLQPYIHSSYITVESIGIILTMAMAQSIAGITATSLLLQNMSISTQQALFALVIGNILSSPLRTLRLQLPMYTAVFPLKTAIALLLCNQSARMISIIFIFLLYFMLFMV